jgi:hypothetical protein
MSVKVILLLLSVNCFVSTAFAGVCIENPPAVINFSRSEEVFIGKVLSVNGFYGIPRTNENWNLKYKTVQFEVLRAFKGVDSGNKIQAVLAYGNIDWEDLKPKKGEQWMIYAWKKEGRRFFGTGCVPWSERIEDQVAFKETDDYLLSLKTSAEKDRQAIAGRITSNWQGIQNVDVIIEGADRRIVVKTDNEGRYYVPNVQPGAYIVKTTIPKLTGIMYSSQKVKTEYPEAANNETTFTYKIDLKSGDFNYNEMTTL